MLRIWHENNHRAGYPAPLARSGESLGGGRQIVATRDSKPVARIIPYVPPPGKKRNRFDPKEHMRWLRRISKGEPTHPSTDELLREDRYDER
jgi:antitoxin (DNA-binding transcriptional repressor) of toxin-antitoxin stability system